MIRRLTFYRAVKLSTRIAQKTGRLRQCLTPQTPFDLDHEVFRQPQVIKGFLEGLGGVLRLAAVALEAFSSGATPALSRFGLSFMILSGTAHGVLLPIPG
jgi:hypothetical protein